MIFKTFQRRVKFVLVMGLGLINLIGILIGGSLLNHPISPSWIQSMRSWSIQPFASIPLLQLTPLPDLSHLFSWILHPIQIHWIALSPSTLLPFLGQTLSFLSTAYGQAVAIGLIVLITSVTVGLTVWLLTVDVPRYFARWVNRRRAAIARRQLKQLMSSLAQVDLDELPPQDARLLKPLSRALNGIIHRHGL